MQAAFAAAPNRPIGKSQRPSPESARPNQGMVLIVVIVLLTLLALIGTAFIGSTRSNRYAARQNALTAQQDLLIDGVKNMAAGYIVGALFDSSSNTFRPTGINSANFHDYTSATGTPKTGLAPRDAYLGERIPALQQDVASAYDATTTYSAGSIVTDGGYFISRQDSNLGHATSESAWWLPSPYSATTPLWPAISAPLGPTGTKFEDPSRAAGANQWDYFQNAFIGSSSITYADGTSSIYPALNGLIAADADGDGIADSGLIRLPMKDLDGLTWYYGIRIIDNNSAVNAAIAWKPSTSSDSPAASVPGNFFPTNIDLGRLLNTGDTGAEMTAWNTWRFNAAGWSTSAVNDSAAARGDFVFLSGYDQLWSQLGRRLDNPGYDTAAAKFQAASRSDQINLAHGFAIKGPSVSNIEWLLGDSLYNAATSLAPSAPYAANMVTGAGGWFNQLFDYNNVLTPTYSFRTARPLLVSRNPVMNTIRPHMYTPTQPLPTLAADPNAMPAYTGRLSKTGVNVAQFPELWRAYWNVMCNDTAPGTLPPNTTNIFRSAWRGAGAAAWTPYQQMLLRAAIAAVNTEDLRDADNNITSHLVTLHDPDGGADVQAMVYGTERQPYITEVLVETGNNANNDYVAIELFNPRKSATTDETISLENWRLVTVNRSTWTFTTIHTFTAFDTIPPVSYLILTDGKKPSDVNPPSGFAMIKLPIPGLAAAALGKDVYLMRPRTTAPVTPATADPNNPYDENNNPYDWIPIAEYDFTGMTHTLNPKRRFHYVLPNSLANAASNWRFTYAGPYVQGAVPAFRWTSNTDATAPTAPDAGQLGLPDTTAYALMADAAAPVPPTAFPLIQLNNVGWGGPNPTTLTGTGNKFPFGGFARNGDILEVPFIGAYRIFPNGTPSTTTELNSVTLDSYFANDPSVTDDLEQIGRFCPGLPTPMAVDPYAWASRLFDYLTVQCPALDYFPDTDPNTYTGKDPEPNPSTVANGSNPSAINSTTTPTEDNAPVNGLININTASWKVLSTLPMVTDATGKIIQAQNTALAKAIFQDRIKNGPFQSIFDLNRVNRTSTPGFATWWAASLSGPIPNLATFDPDNSDGDITPLAPSDQNVQGDFEARYLALNRISNLITTRSDSFTVYIVLEGWQNAGSPTAKRITQRRAAYIIDRSGVTATSTAPQVTYVPNQ
jgi:hypothetical protein